MTMSAFFRRNLANALGSQSAANAICTIIDADTGTVAQDGSRRIWNQIGVPEGTVLATALGADTALTDPVQSKLNAILGTTAVIELTAEQGG